MYESTESNSFLNEEEGSNGIFKKSNLFCTSQSRIGHKKINVKSTKTFSALVETQAKRTVSLLD